ncbi:hypothetical protein HRbin15_01149 [bacterium HR15]|nr:hypothetical protein HRbin15_01149 [bacterium HR15]
MAKVLAWLCGIVILGATVGHASWEQAFSDYEKWAQRKTFEWVIETEDKWKEKEGWEFLHHRPPSAVESESKWKEEEKGNRLVRHRWLLTIQNSAEVSYWQAKLLYSSLEGMTDENVFYNKDFCIFYYTKDREYHILPCTLYEGIPNGIGVDLPRLHPAFLAGAHPFRCTNIVNWIFDKKPPIFERLKGISPIIENNIYIFSVSGYQHPRGNWALEWALDAFHGYRPLRFSFVCGPRFEYRVLRWTQADGYWVPAEMLYTETNPSRQTSMRIKLIRIYPTNEPVAFPIPKGGTVVDLRLNDYVNSSNFSSSLKNQVGYLYIGHLPTKEELKRLAYQQGNLVPPETSRQRYSLWLFAPAILFFLAAAYLYFKNRRQ